MINDIEPPSEAEAMIIPLGAAISRDNADFEGPLDEARHIVAAMSAQQRADVVIWTPGHLFGAAELLAERDGHEHDSAA